MLNRVGNLDGSRQLLSFKKGVVINSSDYIFIGSKHSCNDG